MTTYAQIPLMLNFNTDPDGDDGLSHVVGPGVGQGDFVAQAGRVASLTREQILVEPLVLAHRRMVLELAGNLMKRSRASSTAHIQINAGGQALDMTIEKITINGKVSKKAFK